MCIKGVRTKPHPQQQKNNDMKLHRVLKSIAEGEVKSSENLLRANAAGSVSTGEGGLALLGGMQKAHARLPTCDGVDAEVGDETAANSNAKPKRTKKPKAEKLGQPETPKGKEVNMRAANAELTSLNNKIVDLKTKVSLISQSHLRQDTFLSSALEAYIPELMQLKGPLEAAIVTGQQGLAEAAVGSFKKTFAELSAPGSSLCSYSDDVRLAALRIKKSDWKS